MIFLHGAGERGKDNLAQLKWNVRDFAKPEVRSKYPCYVMAPQCPADDMWSDYRRVGELPEKPTAPLQAVMEETAVLMKNLPIDYARLYVGGLSMGGFGTWDLLARWYDRIAAAFPICGGGDPGTAKKFSHIAIWTFHGAKDEAVPVSRTREMVAALKKHNSTVKYTEYPKVGHDSWKNAFAEPDLFPWLFEQRLKHLAQS